MALRALEKWFSQQITELNGPGAVVAVSVAGEDYVFAAGKANLRTGAPVTEETRFQIGSNTKAMTATLIYRALEQQRLSLDQKIVDLIPGFQTSDAETTARVTVRDLLLHRSGIGSHFFKDFGRGNDAIARLVEHLPEAGCDFPLGLAWGYSNAGIVVLGRVLECVYDLPYAAIVEQELLAPLGMTETSQTPEDTILYSHAVGHEINADGKTAVASHYVLPPAMAPSGATLTCAIRDFLKFGKLWLDQGIAQDGEPFLKDSSIESLLKPEIRVPAPLCNRWMMPLMVEEYFDGHRRWLTAGHTIGQTTTMMLFPEQNSALVTYANGPAAAQLCSQLCEKIIETVLGLIPRKVPTAPDTPPSNLSVKAYLGTYESYSTRIEVSEQGGDLQFLCTGKNLPEHMSAEPQQIVMRAVGDHGFISPDNPAYAATFLDVGENSGYLFMHGIFTRVDPC